MEFVGRIRAIAGEDRATFVAIVLSVVWLVLVALFWLLGPDAQPGVSGLMRLASIVGVLMPIVLIWLAAGLARSIAALREEADDLRARLAQLRPTAAADPMPMPMRAEPRPAAAAQPVATPKPARPAPVAERPQPVADARQSAMRFDAPESIEVGMDDLVHALNFPDGPDDQRGIVALRNALQDHEATRVIRSAQDVITLLAEADIYMDDLALPEPDVAQWRRYADGARDARISQIAAIQDPDTLDATETLLKHDEIFRDTAHHFLRHFDLAVTRWAPGMSDAQLSTLADTRSARAFMMLGKVTGVFG